MAGRQSRGGTCPASGQQGSDSSRLWPPGPVSCPVSLTPRTHRKEELGKSHVQRPGAEGGPCMDLQAGQSLAHSPLGLKRQRGGLAAVNQRRSSLFWRVLGWAPQLSSPGEASWRLCPAPAQGPRPKRAGGGAWRPQRRTRPKLTGRQRGLPPRMRPASQAGVGLTPKWACYLNPLTVIFSAVVATAESLGL